MERRLSEFLLESGARCGLCATALRAGWSAAMVRDVLIGRALERCPRQRSAVLPLDTSTASQLVGRFSSRSTPLPVQVVTVAKSLSAHI